MVAMIKLAVLFLRPELKVIVVHSGASRCISLPQRKPRIKSMAGTKMQMRTK